MTDPNEIVISLDVSNFSLDMTDPDDFSISLDKESIRTRIQTLAVLLGLLIAWMGYLTMQMPKGHMAKIFGM